MVLWEATAVGGPPACRTLLAFASFACRYWLLAYPRARRAVHRYARAAAAIPDPHLRRAAVETLAEERGNLEGAAVFATCTPRRHRAATIEALVAFQAIFDYVDTLAEQPTRDVLANARAVHLSLLVALTPGSSHPDYYAHAPSGHDGGYLRDMVDRCRGAFETLPSHAAVQRPLHRAVRRMIEYQTLIHGDGALAPVSLASWAERETPPASGLRWWETAASGASSLIAFALIAAATDPDLSSPDIEAIERAYFPWIGSLHVLLDSLIDWSQDVAAGHHSLVEHYDSAHDAAARMESIGLAALDSTRALPQAGAHAMFLAAMAGFYLAKPDARLPHAAETTDRLVAALGHLAQPVLIVHGIRGWVGSLRGVARR
jgi:tetraprenyl-beta-curcumene synthase